MDSRRREHLVQIALTALEDPEVQMDPRVQRKLLRAGRFTSAQMALHRGISLNYWYQLCRRFPALRELGIAVGRDGRELDPGVDSSEVAERLFDPRVVDLWFWRHRGELPPSCDLEVFRVE